MNGTTHAIKIRRALERDIVAGELKAGDKLDEVAIAKRFNVSRTPVREALMQMQASDLVERRQRVGATVKGWTLRNLVQNLEFEAGLEGFAAYLAARRARPSDMEKIERALAECERLALKNDPDGYYDANVAFHWAVYEASYNDVLVSKIEAASSYLLPFFRAQHHRAGWIEKTVDDHREMLAALKARDADLCAHLFRKHVHFDSEQFADIAVQLD